MLSCTWNLYSLSDSGVLILGNLLTCRACTEYPIPVPPNRRNINSEKNLVDSAGAYAQLKMRFSAIRMGRPPNCRLRILGRTFLVCTKFLYTVSMSSAIPGYLVLCISALRLTISVQDSRRPASWLKRAYLLNTVISASANLSFII